ncbi:hypothetical protein HID58_088985, partial [Brassica napus]
MDACFSLSRNVGEMRTETELLPQCWEQINHTYQERRLLVAQSCGELAEYVRPEICDSLILSIIQQLIEDSATVVREAAAHNLALLLPLFPNTDKYFKVEEMMFQFICDPSGLVAETTLKELLPAVMKCSPLSRIELRTVNFIRSTAHPFRELKGHWSLIYESLVNGSDGTLICIPEGSGNVFVPVYRKVRAMCGLCFLAWDLCRIIILRRLKPRTAVASRLATHCILPLLLAGVLGAPSKHEELTNILRQILLESKTKENQSSKRNNNEVLDAVHFL